MLLTRLPLDLKEASFLLLSFDLHVLSTPPAFVLSQDQTLHDRSFVWLDYFLPCSNSLLGIATSHIGLIRSLYCSVFKEPSLFKRLDYLTTFVEVCQMIFLKSFSSLFRTGPLHQRRVLSYHTAFFVSTGFYMFFEMALSRCGVSLWLVWRKGFLGFLIAGFPCFAFLTLSALPHTKKISRSARNDGAGRGYPGLHVLSIKKGDVK